MSLLNKILSSIGLDKIFSESKASREARHVKETLKMTEYVSKNIGQIYSTVSFNMLTTEDPLTIIIVGPTKERDNYLLVTSGMSSHPMYNRPDCPYYTELILGLPRSWRAPKNEDDLSNLGPDDLYPLIMLLKLAELPRLTGQAISSGDVFPIDAYEMEMTRAMLDLPALPDPEFPQLHMTMNLPSFVKVAAKDSKSGDDEYLIFEGVYPITEEEYALKEWLNSNALMNHLNSKGVGLIFDLHRKSTYSKDDARRAGELSKEFKSDVGTSDAGDFDELLKKHAKIFEKNSISVGQIKITGETPDLKDSKFGGEPYWPVGKEYPTSPEGERMVLLAQINCADVPISLGWPQKGIVQFYIVGNDDLYGSFLDDPTVQDGFRVVYHEDIELESESQPVDANAEYLPFDITQAKKIEIIEGTMLPDIDMSYVDPKLEDIVSGHEEAYDEYRASKRNEQFGDLEEHQIGGFPHFIQGDPREVAQAKTGYAKLLLQISSDDENAIQWGDYGSAQFFISAANLKKKDFSKVMYTWACH